MVAARTNDGGGYPPVFYGTLRAFVGSSLATSVVWMRLFNTLLCAVILGAAIHLATPLLRRSVSLAWLGSLVPLAMFVVPSTNPSSWVVTGIGTYWAFLLLWLRGEPGKRHLWAGALASISALIAAGARADGAAFLSVSTVAVLLLTGRQGIPRRRLVLPAIVVAVSVTVFLLAGQSSAIAGLGGAVGLPERGGPDLLLANLNAYPSLIAGVFGQSWGLGWLDTVVPPGAAVLSAAAAFSLVVLSATSYWRSKAVAVGLVAAVLVILPLWILQGGGNLVGENVQPRYLLPLVTVLLGLSLMTRDGDRPWTLGWPRTSLLVLAVAAANALSLQAEIRRYVTGNDVSSLRLDQGVEWWWGISIGPMAAWVMGSLAGLALFAALGWAAQLPTPAAPSAASESGPTSGREGTDTGRQAAVLTTE
jgi:hypothetical protein